MLGSCTPLRVMQSMRRAIIKNHWMWLVGLKGLQVSKLGHPRCGRYRSRSGNPWDMSSGKVTNGTQNLWRARNRVVVGTSGNPGRRICLKTTYLSYFISSPSHHQPIRTSLINYIFFFYSKLYIVKMKICKAMRKEFHYRKYRKRPC